MPKKKRVGLFVELPQAVLDGLSQIDNVEGLPRDEFLRHAMMEKAMDLLARRAKDEERRLDRETKRGVGRPSVHRPRLAEDIETSNNASGYTGVFAYGKSFKAFWDKHEANGFLGVWDNAEDAAFARYWFMKGRNTLATEMLGRGSPDPYATQREFHMHMRGLEPKKPYAIGDVVDYDPVYTQGPIRRQVRIVEGPFPLEDEMVGWKLFGVNGIVPSIDFERSKG